jgi:ubiquitin conjugation factor E4 B
MINGDVPKFALNEVFLSMPEYLINDIFEFHSFFMMYNEDYPTQLPTEIITTLVNFTVWILANVEIVTNPYSKGNIVELLYLLALTAKEKLLECLQYNDCAKSNLTAELMKFYIDIEFTGASHQFYAKYQYRHYVGIIFKAMWKLIDYQNAVKSISGSSVYYFLIALITSSLRSFERFINMILNDTTYCMDEAFEKIKSIDKYEEMKDTGRPLSEEDEQNLEQSIKIVKSLMPQTQQCIEILASLSGWTPNSILAGGTTHKLARVDIIT